MKLTLIFVSVVFGLTFGLGTYTFVYAKGYSYLTNDSKSCYNCHIMKEQYDSWIKSSHHAVTSCNSCHTPNSLLPKYMSKASNGFWHSFAFTTGRFEEPIRIKLHNMEITENACRNCHKDIVEEIDGSHNKLKQISCISCHGSVGHPKK